MAKTTAAGTRVLARLLGKSVVFQGKFEWGLRERLTGMAKAQQGVVNDDLDASTDYLVLADAAGGKTVQKRAAALNAKGASIQVTDAAAFQALVEPTPDEILKLIRGGAAGILENLIGSQSRYNFGQRAKPALTIAAEAFDGVDLSGFDLSAVTFDRCTFVGARLDGTTFRDATGCDFSRSTGASTTFGDVENGRFVEANLKGAQVHGHIGGADFSAAILEGATFWRYVRGVGGPKQLGTVGCVFARASLAGARFMDISLKSPNFDGAYLNGASVTGTIEEGSFRDAIMGGAVLVACRLPKANFTGADLRGANLAEADLTDACFDGADLERCNLRGAKLGGAALGKAKHYDPAGTPTGAIGPALTELDAIATSAKRICISVRIRKGNDDEGEEASVDTTGLKYGWGLRLPDRLAGGPMGRPTPRHTLSGALLQMSDLLGHCAVRFETVEVESTKSPTGGKALRELAINAISEAFAQPTPAAEVLAAATAAYREQVREQGAADRERREAAKKAAEKQKETAKKQIAKQIAREVGKVTDIATFLKALELRADKQKIDKATKMLKASGFQLFNDVTDEHMNGVVKSQTDPDLVYACRIESDGHYACCTQNLNICGGLRGSICKHLLVLIIGLVKAGELDPTTIDGWVAKSHDVKPELDKEAMGDIFIRYKGAEAGEVDWRPTETVPEDYYAL